MAKQLLKMLMKMFILIIFCFHCFIHIPYQNISFLSMLCAANLMDYSWWPKFVDMFDTLMAMSRPQRISQIPATDRPREKLAAKGAAALSDFELLEVVIGTGSGKTDVGTIARQVQKRLRQGGGSLTYDSLTAIAGVSMATASKLLAALELTRRQLLLDGAPLVTIDDILARLDDIRGKQQEHLQCLSLDGGQRLIAQRTITIGTLDTVLAHPRELFADAIADRAACIVVAHNHPSGSMMPTAHDITLTQQLAAAGQLLGIQLRDHIIVSKNNYYSFSQHHRL
jgi:DNA repair protein RadC